MSIIGDVVQCFGCDIFDRLFRIVSAAAASIYQNMVVWAWILLLAFWAAYVAWVVYSHLADKEPKDWLYQESVKPVLINSLIVCVLLGMGAQLPKFIAAAAFEPVAGVAAAYSEAVLKTTPEVVEQKAPYVPQKMNDDGFFRVELRDKIIHMMKVSVAQFQSMMNLGLEVMKKAFSLGSIAKGAGMLCKHILMFMMGAYLFYAFFRLFLRFCFYFADVIVALVLFAFFFPFTLVFFVFKNSKAADWVKNMGDRWTPTLFKDVINAIASLAVAVVVYAIVMVIVAKFFSSGAMSSNEIVGHVLSGTISKYHFGDENLTNLTLFGCIVLGFLLNYMTEQIPKIGKELFEAFGVKDAKSPIGDDLDKKVEGVVKNLVGGTTKKIKALVSDGDAPEGS